MVHQNEKTCLAIGAGAIGKSVTGYIFHSLGCKVIFADINRDIVQDISQRKGYVLRSTQTGYPDTKQLIDGISALSLRDPRTEKIALEADYICTSIGSKGFSLFLPTLAAWIKKRMEFNKNPLYLMLFENDILLKQTILDYFSANAVSLPEQLKIIPASIERMSQSISVSQGRYDVIGEQFFPVILQKGSLGGSGLETQTEYFQFVDNVQDYYYRKLFTNNLGHAVLGYVGLYRGHSNTVQAMEDPYVYDFTRRVLAESEQMLQKKYAFAPQELHTHIKNLLLRYHNTSMEDSLARLVRDPLRKLKKDERIVGPLLACDRYNLPADSIMTTLFYVLIYCKKDAAAKPVVEKLLHEEGISGVLTHICSIPRKKKIFSQICRRYGDFIPE
jgi:mannitol-1-phosphate 5-dehydrogenase